MPCYELLPPILQSPKEVAHIHWDVSLRKWLGRLHFFQESPYSRSKQVLESQIRNLHKSREGMDLVTRSNLVLTWKVRPHMGKMSWFPLGWRMFPVVVVFWLSSCKWFNNLYQKKKKKVWTLKGESIIPCFSKVHYLGHQIKDFIVKWFLITPRTMNSSQGPVKFVNGCWTCPGTTSVYI